MMQKFRVFADGMVFIRTWFEAGVSYPIPEAPVQFWHPLLLDEHRYRHLAWRAEQSLPTRMRFLSRCTGLLWASGNCGFGVFKRESLVGDYLLRDDLRTCFQNRELAFARRLDIKLIMLIWIIASLDSTVRS